MSSYILHRTCRTFGRLVSIELGRQAEYRHVIKANAATVQWRNMAVTSEQMVRDAFRPDSVTASHTRQSALCTTLYNRLLPPPSPVLCPCASLVFKTPPITCEKSGFTSYDLGFYEFMPLLISASVHQTMLGMISSRDYCCSNVANKT